EARERGVIVGVRHECLVQASFKQCKWQDVARRLHLLRIGRVLPAFGENAVLLKCEAAGGGENFRAEGRRGGRRSKLAGGGSKRRGYRNRYPQGAWELGS